ncbi:MAG TPA: HAD-IA family hydrolase [Phenylobacterium sp.]|uniref:HAD family hydrolase n=1 Tax=Phenylobacterium sp. TaxID=1871053 RepID=UPI002F928DA3
MSNIEALILDVGGVLIETPARDARSAWERAHGLEQGQLDRILIEAIGPGWEGGRSETEIEARLCQACGIDSSGLTDLLDALSADEQVCPYWRLVLDDIVGTLPLALLTNSGPKTRSALVARHGLERWFSVIVISAEERVSKPDPRIYRRTCERLGRSPAQCLFVDDRQSNIAGAEAAGLAAIHFVSPDETIPLVLDRLGLGHLPR